MSLKNFDQPLLDEDDKPITESSRNEHGLIINTRIITIGRAISKSLSATLEGDHKIDFTQKIERYNLWKLLKNGGDIEINLEQVNILKDAALKGLGIVAFGQVIEALEKNVTEEK